MADKMQVWVFGKAGCPKCKMLNKRLDTLLKSEEWQGFEKRYWDVETEEGLVTFCKLESANPQRIPALVIARPDPAAPEGARPIPAFPPAEIPAGAAARDLPGRLFTCLGLETDYSGKGVITPKMVKTILREAMASCNPS